MQGNPQQTLLYAYIAGLFDGEGSFCICKQAGENYMKSNNRKNPHYHPLVRIGMNIKEPMILVKNVLGCGNIYEEGVRKDREGHKPMFRWTTVKKKEVIQVIDILIPYLTVKKEQASIVRDFSLHQIPSFRRNEGVPLNELQYREEMYQKVRKLNGVGVAATTKSLKAERSSDSLIS